MAACFLSRAEGVVDALGYMARCPRFWDKRGGCDTKYGRHLLRHVRLCCAGNSHLVTGGAAQVCKRAVLGVAVHLEQGLRPLYHECVRSAKHGDSSGGQQCWSVRHNFRDCQNHLVQLRSEEDVSVRPLATLLVLSRSYSYLLLLSTCFRLTYLLVCCHAMQVAAGNERRYCADAARPAESVFKALVGSAQGLFKKAPPADLTPHARALMRLCGASYEFAGDCGERLMRALMGTYVAYKPREGGKAKGGKKEGAGGLVSFGYAPPTPPPTPAPTPTPFERKMAAAEARAQARRGRRRRHGGGGGPKHMHYEFAGGRSTEVEQTSRAASEAIDADSGGATDDDAEPGKPCNDWQVGFKYFLVYFFLRTTNSLIVSALTSLSCPQCTCQGFSNRFATSHSTHSWGVAPHLARPWWASHACKTSPGTLAPTVAPTPAPSPAPTPKPPTPNGLTKGATAMGFDDDDKEGDAGLGDPFAAKQSAKKTLRDQRLLAHKRRCRLDELQRDCEFMWGAPAGWRHELWQAHCAWRPFKTECHHSHANWLGLSDPAWVSFCATHSQNGVCARVRALQHAQPGLKAFMSKAAADTAAVAAAVAKAAAGAHGSSRKTAYDDDDPAAPAHQQQ